MRLFDLDRFKSVVFDLDSTLTDTHRYPLQASLWLLKQSGIESEEESADYLRSLVARYRVAIEEIAQGAPYRPPFEIVRLAMGLSLEDINHRNDPVLVEEATRIFKQLHVELSTVYPGVEEVLTRLRAKGIPMGVLSNSFEGHAEIILEKLGLRHYFDAVVDGGVIKAFKPMPLPFLEILEMLGAQPEESLYVGDEYYADIVGAKSIGMAAVWINSRNVSLEDLVVKHGPETSPDYVLSSVAELMEMLPD